ncbi:uncharacterized protein J4E88_007949 [Alternaria novae-zelandiae]|uniref:uncharacterized protein n=1 Tax=Alternaria novae-zelandiae TaxID=430562 RepID=UPI0020C5AE25|nr:uncharacterized protein J4E88_007949 [Alternaria novae-zelandiae]KAI4675045.1 hypothetical protein J4E88_007949 [Alternaria novae-zelandiae]
MAGEKLRRTKKTRLASSQSWQNHPIGYPRLSERMGLKPETLIFRKFVALNARMLLYMQAELAVLEKTLQEVEINDHEDKDANKRQYATDYVKLSQSDRDGDTYQLELVEKISSKLGKYNKALLQQYKLHQIPEPDRFDLNDVYCLLHSDAMGGGELSGEDRVFWGLPDDSEMHAPDLIGVCPREQADPFSRWVSENAIHLFKCGIGRLKKADKHFGRRVYYDTTVLRATSWMTSILASLLPIASILILLHLETLSTKLWVIGAFNVLLSVCLRTLTEAKRAEVFAVTAA